jgi:fucose permease
MYSFFSVGIVSGLCLLVVGLIALLAKQPYHVWYSFLLSGFLITVILSGLLPAMRNRFIQNEMRQMSAKDL